MVDRVRLFRRRQFVLGPEYIRYEGWITLSVQQDYLLSVHPDLPTTVVARRENKAILLGYAIDPHQPELNDEAILERFVRSPMSIGETCSGLHTLNGRFVLIVSRPGGLWLFPDPCALRQVQYCRDQNGSVWCASQAETLAERLGFGYAEDVLSFRDMPAYRQSTEEFWLINDRTPYREIRNLLANHYLDLRQGKAFRFWPEEGCLDSLSLGESIRVSTPILQNTIKAAADRFDLKMGISAGSDSRRTLAASKGVKEKIYFFTHTPQAHGEVDMRIPARLLPKLGLQHHELQLQAMSPEFRKYYESSATWARERRGSIAFTAFSHFGPDATVLNSNLSEIPQCYYWLPKSEINGKGLALATRLNHPFATSEFQKWLDDAQPACANAKMNILTLFDIELRSRWVAAALSEYDIAHETFNPYNNRYLLSLDLAVNERHRRSRQKDLLLKQIQYMWPDVLIEPINPPERVLDRIREFIWKSVIHRTVTPWFPIYDYLRYIKLKREFDRHAVV